MKTSGVTVAMLLLLAGCSGSAEHEQETEVQEPETQNDSIEEEEKAEETDDDSTSYSFGDLDRFGSEPQEWMQAAPGSYSEDDYDEDEVMTILSDSIESGTSDDELFLQVLDLTAFDYRNYIEEALALEIDYEELTVRPGDTSSSEEDVQGLHVQVLFDASGSMAQSVGDEIKMDAAKEAVHEFAAELPEHANISLRVYGHQGSNLAVDQEESCAGTEELYPLAPYEEAAFTEVLDSFEPTGYTPIAASIEAAGDDLLAYAEDGDEVVVYIVSDGEETCGGDPVQAAADLNESGINAVVHIIGFDVEDDEHQALMDIASAGGGDYMQADDAETLRQTLREEQSELISAWREWQAENTDVSREQQSDYLDRSRELQETITDLSRAEQDRLTDLSRALEEQNDDYSGIPLRSSVTDRGIAIRSYITESMIQFRQQAVDEGIQNRQDITEEGINERQDIIQGDDNE